MRAPDSYHPASAVPAPQAAPPPRTLRQRKDEAAKAGEPVPQAATLDISAAVAGWDHEPGRLNVRKIAGDDGLPKLQVRLDLGLLQMELSGRPDGKRPHDFESLLDYQVDRLNAHRTRYGTELGFVLSPNDCRELRDEAAMYYHRYLGLFVLSEYGLTLRDTARNLRAMDFCARHAAEERDRVAMERFRPYLLMMRARASAGLAIQQGQPRRALRAVRTGLRELRRHFRRFGGGRAWRQSGEGRVLKRLSMLLRRHVPQSPVRRLKRKLRFAIRHEQYERAARLRDEISRRGLA